MKHIWSASKYITYTYYGDPVDLVTLTLDCAEWVGDHEKQLMIENAQRRLMAVPVRRFPVAGAHGSLLNQYSAAQEESEGQ